MHKLTMNVLFVTFLVIFCAAFLVRLEGYKTYFLLNFFLLLLAMPLVMMIALMVWSGKKNAPGAKKRRKRLFPFLYK